MRTSSGEYNFHSLSIIPFYSLFSETLSNRWNINYFNILRLHDPDPLYENTLNCVSLDRYQISDSGSEEEVEYAAAEEYAEVERHSSKQWEIVEHPEEQFSSAYTELIIPGRGAAVSSVFYSSNLRLSDSVPAESQYCSKPEELVLPNSCKAEETLVVEPEKTPQETAKPEYINHESAFARTNNFSKFVEICQIPADTQ